KPAAPPEVWTDLATGEFPSRHGVRALARVRPAGSPGGLRPPLGTAWYLRRRGPAPRLVTSASVSAVRRRRLPGREVAAWAGLARGRRAFHPRACRVARRGGPSRSSRGVVVSSRHLRSLDRPDVWNADPSGGAALRRHRPRVS